MKPWFNQTLSPPFAAEAKVLATTDPDHPTIERKVSQPCHRHHSRHNPHHHAPSSRHTYQGFPLPLHFGDNPDLPPNTSKFETNMSVFARRFIDGDGSRRKSVFPNLDTTDPLQHPTTPRQRGGVGIDVGTTNRHTQSCWDRYRPQRQHRQTCGRIRYQTVTTPLTYAQQVARINTWTNLRAHPTAWPSWWTQVRAFGMSGGGRQAHGSGVPITLFSQASAIWEHSSPVTYYLWTSIPDTCGRTGHTAGIRGRPGVGRINL